MFTERSTQIGTLRVRCASKDNLSLRLALASLLNSAELGPRGVPPSSVLIVRNMTDPLPGHLAPHRQTVRVDIFWEKAVQDSLSEIYRRATRPKKGYLLPGSEAVLFADEGEMLACLVLDISRGDAQRQWWWSKILHTLPSLSSKGLTMLLNRKAIYVPAVIHHLVEWQQATKLVTTLSPSQIMSVLSAMCKEYDLVDFGANVFYPKELPRDELSGDENLRLKKRKPQHITPGLKASKEEKLVDARPLPSAAPWEQWFPPMFVPPDLTRERACLLGLALSLYHHPIEVRSDIFPRRVRDWWVDAQVQAKRKKKHPVTQSSQNGLWASGILRDSDLTSHTEQAASYAFKAKVTNEDATFESINEMIRPAPQSPSDKKEITGEVKISSDVQSMPTNKDSANCENSLLYNINQVARSKSSVPINKDNTDCKDNPRYSINLNSETQTEEFVDSRHKSPIYVLPAGTEVGLKDKNRKAVKEETADSITEGISTQLGGLLYLINLMRHLDLPRCFEDECALASQVGSWGVLELLGRALLEKESKNLLGDPIWQILADLDSRDPDTLPGENFQGSNSFRLPMQWLNLADDMDSGTWNWAAKNKRLRLWSAKGYLLIDVPQCGASPLAQATEEFWKYSNKAERIGLLRKAFARASVHDLSGRFIKGLNSNLIQWLSMVMPYIRFRLKQALNQDSSEEIDLAKALLLCRGRLYLTSTHVDLVVSLDDISLPIRKAGLDCNPDWVPNFRRVVKFHFE